MNRSFLISVALLAVVAIVVLIIRLIRVRGPGPDEIMTADEFKRKYPKYFSRRPKIKLNPRRVPGPLRHLIPLAERWGIGDDIIRTDVEKEATNSDKQELREKVDPQLAEIQSWLNSFPSGRSMTDEAAAFMFMLEAMNEMDI